MQTLQHEGTLLGVCDVPPDYGFWVQRAPFTTKGAIVLRKERDGWVLCHGGSMLFAFRFTEPSKWDQPNPKESLDLLRCDSPRSGWILETAPISAFAGGGPEAEIQRFGDALKAKTKIQASTSTAPPRLVFTNLKGRVLDLRWKPLTAPLKNECLVDGTPVDYGSFPLLKTHHALQQPGGNLTLTLPGGKTRILDFKAWTSTSSPAVLKKP
jgi:hypothetical protein